MSTQMGCLFLLIAIGCSLVPCVTPCERQPPPTPEEWASLTSSVNRSINWLCLNQPKVPFLPEELAVLVKQMSYDAGWVFVSGVLPGRNITVLINRAETLKKKSVGLLPAKTVDELKDMLLNLATVLWNEHLTRRSAMLWNDMNNCPLINDIVSMAGNIDWSIIHNKTYLGLYLFIHGNCAHDMDLPKNILYDIDFHFNNIRGTPRVRRVVFQTDNPLDIGRPFELDAIEHITNNGSEPITLKRTYVERHGRTISVTRSMQFSAKVSTGFNYGFNFRGFRYGILFSFESVALSSTTFMEEVMKETTVLKDYTFTLPPGESAVISVRHRQMYIQLLYTVELDFNGIIKNMTGIWEGFANSDIEVYCFNRKDIKFG